MRSSRFPMQARGRRRAGFELGSRGSNSFGVTPVNTISPFKTSVCGIEELTGHCESCVSHVLSILDPDWPVPDAFGAYGEHARLELRFHDIIEQANSDMIAPQQGHVADLLAFGRRLLEHDQDRKSVV